MPGGVRTSANDARGARLPRRITRGRPAQQKSTADRKRGAGFFRKRKKGSIGQIVDREPMPALAASVQALGMQHAVDVSGF